MRYGVMITAFLAALILSGCGSDDAEGECRYEAEYSIDKGDFDKAVDLLTNDPACQGAYESNITYASVLGAAYLGKSGLSVSEVAKTLITSSDENNPQPLSQFVSDVNQKRAGDALETLSIAKEALKSLYDGCSGTDLSYDEKNLCLVSGLVSLTEATVTFGYLTDYVDTWLYGTALQPAGYTIAEANASGDANGNDIPDDMDAAICGLEYAIEGACSATGVGLVVVQSGITFDTNRSYSLLEIEVSDNGPFYELIGNDRQGEPSLVITQGYCGTDFSDYNDSYQDGLYPCPVIQRAEQEDLTVTDAVLSALNEGFEEALVLVDDADLSQSIRDARAEIDTDGDEVISRDELLEFLRRQEL